MPNQFSITPAGDMSRGLAGLSSVLENVRVNRQEAAEKNRVEDLKAQAADVFATNDPYAIAEFSVSNPEMSGILKDAMGIRDAAQEKEQISLFVDTLSDPANAKEHLIRHIQTVERRGDNADNSRKALQTLVEQGPEAYAAITKNAFAGTFPTRFNAFEKAREGEEATAAQKDFASLSEGLSAEELLLARRIQLGLEPRAVGAADKIVFIGGVPHVFDPGTQAMVPVTVKGKEVTTKSVGESQSNIAAATKQAQEQAAISANFVKTGFEKIGNIRKNVLTLDRAIDALDAGANSGFIAQFVPSITEASRNLDVIQSELGLDVVGAVSFGALSKGELDLALDTALDTGLDEGPLRDLLTRKKAAQTKLLGYFERQVSFLSGVNSDGTVRTVAQFLEQGKAELPEGMESQINEINSFSDDELLDIDPETLTPTQRALYIKRLKLLMKEGK